MPIYEYECQACKHRLEEYQSFQAEPLRTCPACGKDDLVRVISGGLAAFVPKHNTVGSLAEQNAKEARRRGEEPPKSFRRTKKPKERPFWRDGDTVNKKILGNPQKYIETGKV
jgi:putative FmdB family regulatory protein